MSTIHDVAEHAGVSARTVSRVLNGSSAVSAGARERVLASIKVLNYRPNAMARSLRKQRSNTIGLIVDEAGALPYANRLQQGAQDLAWRHNMLLLPVSTGRSPEQQAAAVQTLLDRRVDGLLYATATHRPAQPPTDTGGVPMVLINCFDEEARHPAVVPNELLAGYTATKHLLETGYRRIGFLNGLLPAPAVSGRLAGYKQALAEAGQAFEPALLVETLSQPAGGYAGARQLLSLATPPNAIFCFSDEMALGVYQYLAETGLKTPEDVAIVGFGDQSALAAQLRPSLTTLKLPHYAMGVWAVKHLLGRIGQKEAQGPPPLAKLACPLITRAST